jgi:hypothetical protein
MNKTRSKLAGLLICLALVISGMLVAGYIRSVLLVIEAEKNLHATNLTIDLVCKHIELSRSWPSNWEDLLRLKPTDEHGIWIWPQDKCELMQRVFVDFRPSQQMICTEQLIRGRTPTFPASEALSEKLSKLVRDISSAGNSVFPSSSSK